MTSQPRSGAIRTHRSLPTIALVATTVLSACWGGSERSVASFCQTFHEESTRLTQKYESRSQAIADSEPLAGLIGGLGSLLEAQGDMVIYFDRLQKVAPEEIEPEVTLLHDISRQNAETMSSGDLTAMLFGGLATSFQASGATNSLDNYIAANCFDSSDPTSAVPAKE